MNNIISLKENEIFVFGSNLLGRHGGGAAKMALDHFGAIYGQPFGFQGQSYAIPTMDDDMKPLSLLKIKRYLEDMIADARIYSNKMFLLTPVGTGIAGYTIGDLEGILPTLPNNVIPTWK